MGGTFTFSWSDSPGTGILAVAGTSVLAILMWGAAIELSYKVVQTVFLIGLAIAGLRKSRRKPRLTIDSSTVAGATSLFLDKIDEVRCEGNVVSAVSDGVTYELVRAREPDVAEYLAEELERRVEANRN